MRLAVVADIHGNIRGLKAVLADLKRTSPDAVVNLGDCVSGPLEAGETSDLLMDLGWQTIRGNHDRWLVERPPERMGRSDRAAFDELTDRHKTWLGALPPTATVGDILLCHGSPQDDLVYLLETVRRDGVVSAATPAEIAARLPASTAPVILCGHTHTPRVVTLPDGRMIVNPGSAGLPAYHDDEPVDHDMEMKAPHVRYALLDRTSGGFDITFRVLSYDWNGAAASAERKGRPDWAHALRTGYAQAS